MQDFDAGVRLDPDNDRPYATRGKAYFFLGEVDRAIQDLEMAILLDPEYSRSYHLRGLIYTSLGNEAQALADLKRAKEIIEKMTALR